MSPHKRRVTKDEHPYASWYERLPEVPADLVRPAGLLCGLHSVPVDAAARAPPRSPSCTSCLTRLPWRMRSTPRPGSDPPVWVQHESNQRMLAGHVLLRRREGPEHVLRVREGIAGLCRSAAHPDRRRADPGPSDRSSRGPMTLAGSGRCSGSASCSTRSGPRWTTASCCPTSTCSAWPTKRASTRPTTPSSSRTRLASEFSYASEHVSHDTAISLLLALDRAVAKLAPLAPGSWDRVREWLSDRLAEVWQARGPCPGLGAALTAFGIGEGSPAGARDPVAHRRQRRPVAPGRPLAAGSIV